MSHAYEQHLLQCTTCRALPPLPEQQERRRIGRLYQGGPEIKVQQQMIGGNPLAFREKHLGGDSVRYMGRWGNDVRDEYRRAVRRRSFFTHFNPEG